MSGAAVQTPALRPGSLTLEMLQARRYRNPAAAIGNLERHMREASHCGSKQQSSSHAMITLLLLVRATYMNGVLLHAHPVRGESHNQRSTTGEVATRHCNVLCALLPTTCQIRSLGL